MKHVIRAYHAAMVDFGKPLTAHGRRRFLERLAVVSVLPALPALAAQSALRIGLTPVFLDDQISFTNHWRAWLEGRLGRPVSFVQRGNYRDIIDMLLAGKIDFAWLCGYPFARHRQQLRLVAVPVWQGQPLYQSYLIAAQSAPQVRSLVDLRGKLFAYSDPDSNSGYLYPQFKLKQMGENPASFFSRTFFTWAHRTVVHAVSDGLADGGAVDGYVWEMLAKYRPETIKGTRIIDKSPLLGFPPFVARADLPDQEVKRFKAALLDMAVDARGAELLELLGLEGFTPGNPSLYNGIVRMVERMRQP